MTNLITILILLGISAVISPELFVVLLVLIGFIVVYNLIYKNLLKDFNDEEDKKIPEWGQKLMAAIGSIFMMLLGLGLISDLLLNH